MIILQNVTMYFLVHTDVSDEIRIFILIFNGAVICELENTSDERTSVCAVVDSTVARIRPVQLHSSRLSLSTPDQTRVILLIQSRINQTQDVYISGGLYCASRDGKFTGQRNCK